MGDKRKSYLLTQALPSPPDLLNWQREMVYKWTKIDTDEPKYSGVPGTELGIISQQPSGYHS